MIRKNEHLLGYSVGQHSDHASLPAAAALGGAQHESLSSRASRPHNALALSMPIEERVISSMQGVSAETALSVWDDEDVAEIDLPNQLTRSLFDEQPDGSWGTSSRSEAASSPLGSSVLGSPVVEEVNTAPLEGATRTRPNPISPKGSASVPVHSDGLWQRVWSALDQLKNSLLQWCSWLWDKLRSQPDRE